MNASLPDTKELAALLSLLDDETPEVRTGVRNRLEEFGGDLSELLPEAAPLLGDSEKTILAEILKPARRNALRDEWLTPGFGPAALGGDWELFESHLRLLSDFLHDGVSIRQPLSDALDLLAEEAQQDGCISGDDLRIWLFEKGRLKPNKNHYYDPRNADLAWCISEGLSNPIGLGIIFMLLGQRLKMEIEGISFPGHFLCRIYEDGYPLIVDCYDSGKLHSQSVLTDPGNDLSREQIETLENSVDLGTLLMRVLNNLIDAFQRIGQTADAELISSMRNSMDQGGK